MFWVNSFSEDGELIFGTAYRSGTGFDQWVFRPNDTVPRLEFLLESEEKELLAELSPNGKWLVFSSDDQLYLKPFEDPGSIQPLATTGGMRPRWSRTGSGIYYESSNAIWYMPIEIDGVAARPAPPLKITDLPDFHVSKAWDLSSDEKRFLVLVEDEVQHGDVLKSINIIVGFFTSLNNKAPLDN